MTLVIANTICIARKLFVRQGGRVPPGRPRRTHAERSASTRQALLDATIVGLVADGYGGTTTNTISRRAGVSVGALQHHFASKAQLMAAAVAQLCEQRRAELADAMTDVDPGVDRLDVATDLMWEMYRGPAFAAYAELWVAARTDDDLATAMISYQADFLAAARSLFADLVATLPAPPPAPAPAAVGVGGPEPPPGTAGGFEPGGDARFDPGALDLGLAFAFAVLDGLALSNLLGRAGTPLGEPTDVLEALKASSRLLFPR
jgi:AcrR family transcriptional regulator